MQADDVVWSVLNGKFCSYKVVTKAQKFCRNENNVNGICSRTTCPLANSQYATVREEKGICYLYSKILERAHQPDMMWEKTKLSRNMTRAKEQIEAKLKYWPKPMRKKCHLRLITIHDYLTRIRRLMLTRQKDIVPVRRKIDRRETKKETKALAAAKLEKVIETELLRRLKENTYGDMYNFSQVAFDRALDAIEEDGEAHADAEEEEVEDEEEVGSPSEFVADFDEESELDDDEMEENVEQEIEDTVGKHAVRQKIPLKSAEARIATTKTARHSVSFKNSNDDNVSDNDDEEEEPDDEGVVTLWRRQKKPLRLEIEYETEPSEKRRVVAKH